ncbi:MAG: ribbon-helix-helix domain-containing protein [Thermodesulfobacteriota bacterium]
MKKINLYVADPQIRKLTEISKKTDLSISELIRKGIDLFIEDYERKQRERK